MFLWRTTTKLTVMNVTIHQMLADTEDGDMPQVIDAGQGPEQNRHSNSTWPLLKKPNSKYMHAD